MDHLFIVQGEGRGHMSQAMALAKILERHGHQVVKVLVGRSPQRDVPAYFQKAFQGKLAYFDSPNFIRDKAGRGIRVRKTFLYNLGRSRKYLKSIRYLAQVINEMNPDRVINFYDLVGGLYALIYKNRPLQVAIAHQYFFEHPDFSFPPGKALDKFLLKWHSRVTALGAAKKLALSFYPAKNLYHARLRVAPPLLRDEIIHARPSKGQHILVYLLNHGYAEDIVRWHEQHPGIPVHVFWDKPGIPDPYQPAKNMYFHQLDDAFFLDHMINCMAFATTAGFESLCEAMYLGKPMLLRPTGGHFEQECNARDAEKIGFAKISRVFDLNVLLHHAQANPPNPCSFREWAAKAETFFITELEG
jgi:uncharacterized protein (TIGR00661 family)